MLAYVSSLCVAKERINIQLEENKRRKYHDIMYVTLVYLLMQTITLHCDNDDPIRDIYYILWSSSIIYWFFFKGHSQLDLITKKNCIMLKPGWVKIWVILWNLVDGSFTEGFTNTIIISLMLLVQAARCARQRLIIWVQPLNLTEEYRL